MRERLNQILLHCLLRFLSFVPWSLSVLLSRILAPFFSRMNAKRARIIDINLKLAFPEMTDLERIKLAQEHRRQLMLGLLGIGHMYYKSDSWLASRFDVEGLDHMRTAYQSGCPVILLVGHMATNETWIRIQRQMIRSDTVMRDAPVYGLYKKFASPVVEKAMYAYRSKMATPIASTEMRKLVTLLKTGGFCLFSMDQYNAKGVEVPFLGASMCVSDSIRRIARIAGAQVMPVMLRTNQNHTHYQLVIGQVLANFPSDNQAADMRQIMAVIEDEVKHQPECYLWVHKLFKSNDPNRRDPYL